MCLPIYIRHSNWKINIIKRKWIVCVCSAIFFNTSFGESLCVCFLYHQMLLWNSFDEVEVFCPCFFYVLGKIMLNQNGHAVLNSILNRVLNLRNKMTSRIITLQLPKHYFLTSMLLGLLLSKWLNVNNWCFIFHRSMRTEFAKKAGSFHNWRL